MAPTSTQLLSASGSSSINVYDTTQADFPVVQTLDKAHPLGIHHLVTAKEAKRAASAGFEGKVKIWSQGEDGVWSEDGEIVGGYALRFLCIQAGQYYRQQRYTVNAFFWQIKTSLVIFGLLQ